MLEDETIEPMTWNHELASFMEYSESSSMAKNIDTSIKGDEFSSLSSFSASTAASPAPVSARETVEEFAKGVAEMTVDLGRSFCGMVKQSLGDEDSFVMRKLRRLRFLNEYLPEDRDPVHSWTVILAVFFVAIAALTVNNAPRPPSPVLKQVYIHPPNATRVMLPDGRYIAYQEQGLPAHSSRFSIIVPHSFLSSRLAGIPGLQDSLLKEFGVRMIAYDLPGFGESDPHPDRNLESSALDMSHVADAVGIGDKFWIVGHSSGSMHIWAAVRFIPERLAGVAMFAPMVNPYDPSMTKEERMKTWEKWTTKRKLMYIMARRLPRFLRYFYYQSFLSGRHGPIDKWLSLPLGTKDRALIEDPKFEEFWQRNVEESIRQGNAKPFVEEAVLQVSNWGFSIADLQTRNKKAPKNILAWLKSMYSQTEEELSGFLGSIHLWQGMDDRVVPPSMTHFIHRILPGATVHMLPNDGHFTYFYFCDECHRQMFTALFGTPLGPLQSTTTESDLNLIAQDDIEDVEVRVEVPLAP